MLRRQKRRFPFAAYAALVFNAAICLAPIVAARAALTAYGERPVGYDGSQLSIEATRQAIDARFTRLAAVRGGDMREAWADWVREELAAGEMSSARGFLLAAPAMLRGPDAASLRERIRVATAGGEDALIDAAVSFLPEDVQAQFEDATASVLDRLEGAALASSGPEPGLSPDVQPGDVVISPVSGEGDSGGIQLASVSSSIDAAPEFSLLGDLRDLSYQASRWTRDPQFDEFAFVLSGVGLTLADRSAREGASVLLSARRAGTLNPGFMQHMQRELYLATPPQRLKRLLGLDVDTGEGYFALEPEAVGTAFRESIAAESLEPLLQDLRNIQAVASETSPVSAVSILSRVQNSADLKRARLVAQAGGDRAVALARHDGDRLLDTARIVVQWTPALQAQLAALGVCFILLVVIALNVVWRSFPKKRRRSAVYALDEYSAG
jgi:hypothetical protein